VEYLNFVANLKGIPRGERKQRVDSVTERCAIGDVSTKLIGKLSKGYRQRVGLAQAIIHNPDVLVLDEPTAGLDPKQILETRDLIKQLAGDHTIILSTHILPEVEQTCEKVIIISKGRLVATDSVQNLTSRLRGAEAIAVEVEPRDTAPLDAVQVRQRLEHVPGVSRVVAKESKDNRCIFEVESLQGRHIRADLARAVVEADWNLTELRPVAFSLEEIFLQLTSADRAAEGGEK
jgi:ABC-2 type transport system ATP-binding protein